jgi:hypothetical protein
MMASSQKPTTSNHAGSLPANDQPAYVRAALAGLSPVQQRFVMDGCFHGDVSMATVRVLRSKGLFYHKITSPNGQCGPMVLTPLGETVQRILKERAS